MGACLLLDALCLEENPVWEKHALWQEFRLTLDISQASEDVLLAISRLKASFLALDVFPAAVLGYIRHHSFRLAKSALLRGHFPQTGCTTTRRQAQQLSLLAKSGALDCLTGRLTQAE